MKVGNKTLSPRDVQVLCVVAGLIVLLLVYFVVYSRFSEKNDALESEIDTRGQYLNELKGYYDNLPVYQKGTADAKVNISRNLEKLPKGIKNEDFLLYDVALHDNFDLDLRTVAFNGDEAISQFDTVVNDVTVPVTGFVATTTTNAKMTYEQFKEFLDYIYVDTNEVTFINSCSLTYDSEDTGLQTSFSISKYYIDYENAEYKPVACPDVPLGVQNLFGSRSAKEVAED